MAEEKKEKKKRDVLTPKQSIKQYCLLVCTKKDKENSKRAVSDCLYRTCPLYPYRKGQYKSQKGPFSENEIKRRVRRLEQARKQVVYAENALKRAEETLEFRREVFQRYVDALEAAKKRVEDSKEKVRQLEINFNEDLGSVRWE